jgi:hypothetical protein
LHVSSRHLQILDLKPLDRPTCRSVVDSFIKKTVQAESSSMAGGAFLTDKMPGVPGMNQTNMDVDILLVSGAVCVSY